jgi:hypothetical protein
MISKEKNVFLIAKENIIQELQRLYHKFIEFQKKRAARYLKSRNKE